MDLMDMQVYLTIVKYNSISKAAEALFLSQSNLSRRLKQLEEELGVQLMYRHKGQANVVLTEKGRDFISIAQKWVDAYTEACSLHTRQSKITLSIAGVHSLNFYILGSLYKALSTHEPPVELTIHTNHTWEIAELLNTHQIDIGFGISTNNYPDITSRLLFQEDYYVVRRSSGHCKEQSVHPQDLKPEMEIYHTWAPEYQEWHNSWWSPNSPCFVKLNAAPLISHFLDTPEHWAIVPHSIAHTLQAEYPLDVLTLTDPPPRKNCYLFRLRHPRANSIRGLEIFDECLETFLKDIP